MDFKKTNKINILTIAAVFLLGGILHVVLYGLDFADCIMQLLYGGLVLLWGLTMTRRITDPRVRHIVWGIVLFLEMYFLLQICKYRLFYWVDTARRYIWLAFYLPMLMIPLLLVYLSLYMNLQTDEMPDPRWTFLSAPAFPLIALIGTNDFHQLFCRTSGTETYVSVANAGIVFYLFWAYVAFLLLLMLLVMLRKYRISPSQKRIWTALLTMGSGVGLLLFYAADLRPKIMGITLWNIGELFAFYTISILETCIQVGLIPANTNYGWVFQKADFPAIIKDSAGRCVYASEGAEQFTHPGEYVHIQTAAISGGSVSWMVDMSAVHMLNRQIEDVTEQVKARNGYLKTQNSLKEERSAVDARNRVYDRIAGIVKLQLEKIDDLLSAGTELDFTERLKKIAVMNAYIKRRSNLELLRQNSDQLSVTEIVTAIAESAEYLKLNSVDVIFRSFAAGKLPGDMAILVYEFFETVVEAVMEDAKMLSVILSRRENDLSLRMVVNSVGFPIHEDWRQETLAACHGKLSIAEDDGDTVFALRFEIGGGCT